MWCLNVLRVMGPADERARLRMALDSPDGFLQGGDPGGGDHWGCTGEAASLSTQHTDHHDRYSFSTRHAPPVRWCARVAARYVDLCLHLTWENIDDECVGMARFAGGVRTAYDEMEWVDDPGAQHMMPLLPGQTLI